MNKIRLTLLIAFAILLINCNNSKDSISTLKMNYSFSIGKNAFEFDKSYPYALGGNFKISFLAFYVSDIVLINDLGEEIHLPNSYRLFENDNFSQSLPSIPSGNYKEIRFSYGVPERVNTQSGSEAVIATDYPQESPLNPATNMYWGWANGYIFSKIEGRIDTDENGSFGDPGDVLFSYHPGNDALFRTVSYPISLQAKENQESRIDVKIDLLALISNCDFLTQPFAHPASNSGTEFEAAKKLVDAWQESGSVAVY